MQWDTDLWQNNELPSDAELQKATKLRLRATEDLLHIDTEIQRLQAKRQPLLKSIDICNAILSPVRRLPSDILQEIFYHCLSTSRNPTLSATEAPMLLTRICSPWRSIAMSSPRIWAKLHIPLPGDPRLSSAYGLLSDKALEVRHQIFSKVMQLRCQAVKEWLDRSGSCPLSLSISYPLGYMPDISRPFYNEEDDGNADLLFQTISPSASRWKHLDLSMPFPLYQKLETNVPVANLSMLRRFKGEFLFPRSDPPGPPGADSTVVPLHIIELPTLRAVSIRCPQITVKLGRYQNSWDRFTEIRLETKVPDIDLLGMLKQCHNLITLVALMQISWVAGSQPFEPSLGLVLLPHLKTLNLMEAGASSRAFCAVHAPSLETLQYKCIHRYSIQGMSDVDEPSPLVTESLLWLVSNAAASLKTLCIDPHTLLSGDALGCFRLAGHVQKLMIGEPPIFPNLGHSTEGDLRSDDYFDLEVLTAQINNNDATSTLPQNNILLPNLESLEVQENYQIEDDSIRRMLTSRIDAAQRGLVSPLRRVKIQIARQKVEDIIPEIVARTRDAGMEMKLELVYRRPGPPYVGRLSPSFLPPDQSASSHLPLDSTSLFTNFFN